MPNTVPANATSLSVQGIITNVERRAVMLAAHRTRKALGVSMSDALKQAWKQLWRSQAYRWHLP